MNLDTETQIQIARHVLKDISVLLDQHSQQLVQFSTIVLQDHLLLLFALLELTMML